MQQGAPPVLLSQGIGVGSEVGFPGSVGGKPWKNQGKTMDKWEDLRFQEFQGLIFGMMFVGDGEANQSDHHMDSRIDLRSMINV